MQKFKLYNGLFIYIKTSEIISVQSRKEIMIDQEEMLITEVHTTGGFKYKLDELLEEVLMYLD